MFVYIFFFEKVKGIKMVYWQNGRPEYRKDKDLKEKKNCHCFITCKLNFSLEFISSFSPFKNFKGFYVFLKIIVPLAVTKWNKWLQIGAIILTAENTVWSNILRLWLCPFPHWVRNSSDNVHLCAAFSSFI